MPTSPDANLGDCVLLAIELLPSTPGAEASSDPPHAPHAPRPHPEEPASAVCGGLLLFSVEAQTPVRVFSCTTRLPTATSCDTAAPSPPVRPTPPLSFSPRPSSPWKKILTDLLIPPSIFPGPSERSRLVPASPPPVAAPFFFPELVELKSRADTPRLETGAQAETAVCCRRPGMCTTSTARQCNASSLSAGGGRNQKTRPAASSYSMRGSATTHADGLGRRAPPKGQ